MISEDKVKLMTSIAILEKREGKHCFPSTAISEATISANT